MHVLFADDETILIRFNVGDDRSRTRIFKYKNGIIELKHTVNDTSYTYNLRRMGTDRLFTVAFDLKNEIDIPAPSWGWENFGK
ncbi:MAG: hypothetical protein Q8P34_04070 [Bacteroidota bacterium]|nr:hypothetical protein [Bacteroidota bacterium]